MKNSRLIYRIFNLLVLLCLPFIALGVLFRWRRRVLSKGFLHWSERWGHFPASFARERQAHPRWWWVHAVSMGEVKAIEPFLRRAPKSANVRILLSVVTPEALIWAVQHHVADMIVAAPIDLPWIVRRAFRQVQPELFISVESEFWPNLLREARRAGARVALINGRLSAHSFQSYSRIRKIVPVLWECLDLFSVRQKEDAERFEALGVPREKIHITGNLKYDLLVTSEKAPQGNSLGVTVVMGSTREGEEAQLLPIMERLRKQYPELRTIWAPRHIDRAGEVETLLRAQGLPSQRKSRLNASNGSVPYMVWDSMGDLLEAYRQADVAVIGGSFVPKGGQNPIEPAALSVPVVFGPSMENFRGVAETLVHQGGARQVPLAKLEDCLAELVEDASLRFTMGTRAKQAIQSQQGATERTLTLLNHLCQTVTHP